MHHNPWSCHHDAEPGYQRRRALDLHRECHADFLLLPAVEAFGRRVKAECFVTNIKDGKLAFGNGVQ